MIGVEELEKQIKDNKISLLVQLKLTKEQKIELTKYAKLQIPRVSNVYPDLRLSTALYLIARKIYDSGDFWGNLSQYLNVEISQSRSVIIGKIFLATLRKYNLFEIKNDKKRNDYVQNILAHGFYPFNYAKNCYEFLYSFYDRNLGRVLPDSIDEDIQDLKNYMYARRHSQDENLFFEDSKNHAGVSYKLINSTQKVIAECDSDCIIDWMYSRLSLIDNYFYNNSTLDMPESLIAWCKEKFENIEFRKFSVCNCVQRFRSPTPFLAYDIVNNAIKLVFPERKFPSDTASVEIEIFKDGLPHNRFELSLYQAYGCIKSEEIEMTFSHSIDAFSEFKIYCNSKLLVTINKNPYRILRSLKSSMGNSSVEKNASFQYFEVDDIFEGEVCLLTLANIQVELDKSIFLYKNTLSKSFSTYIFNMSKESTVLINDIPFDISDAEKKQAPYKLFFNSPENFYIETESEDTIASTYAHPKIYFNNIDDLIPQNPFIWCNNLKFNLKNTIEYKQVASDVKYAILDLQKLVEGDIGEYTISLDIPGHMQRKTLSKYLLVKDLRFRTDSNIYAFKKSAIVTKYTDLNINPINAEKIKGLNDKYEYQIQEENLSTPKNNKNSNIVKFEVVINEKTYIINIPLKVLTYSFNNKKWFCMKKDYVWDYDLTNYIYAEIPDVSEALLMLGNDSYYPIHSINDNGKLKFDITDIISRLGEEAFNDTLNLEFSVFGKIYKKEICKLLNRVDVKHFKLDYDSEAQMVFIDADFESGKYVFSVEIFNLETGETIDAKLKQGKNYFAELNPQGVYNIIQYIEEEPMFFADEEVERTVVNILEKQTPTNVLFLPSNCLIVLDDLYFEGRRYPLGYNYRIMNSKALNYNYRGFLQVNKNRDDNIYVKFNFVNNNNNQIYIELSDHIEFCYDKVTKLLVPSNDPNLPKDYDRYLFLDNDFSFFNVTIIERRKDY